jgi:hypothetical protein
VTAFADDIIIGGMSYFVDPNMKKSNVNNGGRKTGDCTIASELLKCATLGKAKRVRIKKVNIELDFDDDDC